MKRITDEEVKHIAALSALKLSDDEIEGMKKHLNAVLEYFETLDGIEVSSVPPTAHIVDAVNVLRADEPSDSLPTEKLMKSAPETDGTAYIVPRVVE